MKNRLDMAGWESIPIPIAIPTPSGEAEPGTAEQSVGADPLGDALDVKELSSSSEQKQGHASPHLASIPFATSARAVR